MTKYSRDELETKILRMVEAGETYLFFAPEELELYPAVEAEGYESVGKQYQGMNLNGVIAPKASFESANLCGSRMRGAILPGSDFSMTRVWGVDLTESDLQETNWASMTIAGCCFKEAKLGKASFCKTTVKHVDFTGVNMVGARVGWGDDFSYCNFHGSSMAHASFDCVDFHHCSFSQTIMRGTTFKSCRFKNCDFVGTDLTMTEFDEHCVFYICEERDTQYRQGQFDSVRYWDFIKGDRAYQVFREFDFERERMEYE